MTVQWQTTLRNSLLTQYATSIGSSGYIEIYTGSQPATCATGTSGTKLATFTMAASSVFASSSGGAISMTVDGTHIPYSATAGNTGTAGYYRIFASDDSTCLEQGAITATGGGGDMTIDNTSIVSGQTVQLTGFTKTAPGA